MLVKMNMKISSNEYFDFIMDRLLEELPKGMKNKVSRADIKKGLSYRQTYQLPKGEFISKKEIVDFVYGEVYRMKMDIPDVAQYISHSITSLANDEIEVCYEEPLETKKVSTTIFHKWKTASGKKRMNNSLRGIEAYIIENRNATSEA